MLRRLSRAACLGLLSVSAATMGQVASPPVAHADDQAALKQITDLNKKALEAYDNLEPEEARKLLNQALEVCATAGLNNHPLKARTHVHLGVVLIGGFKQRDLAIRQFKRAMEIQPDIKLTRSLVNPETQAAFDEAKAGGGGSTAETKPEETKPTETKTEAKPEETKAEPASAGAGDRPPENVKGIFHRPIADSPPGQAIEIKAAVQSDLEFTKVIVAYRPEGASDFLQRPMQKDDAGWYVARIPEVATQGGLVSYYIEARAKGDKSVAANGSAAEPHVVTIAAASAGAVASGGGGGGGSDASVSDGEEPGATDGSGGFMKKSIWVGIGLGTGGGWFKGTPEVNQRDLDGNSTELSGSGMSNLLHIAPEVFFRWSPRVVLSVQGRFQVVSGATQVYDMSCASGVCSPAKGAIAVLGKLSYFLTDEGSFRPFVSGMAGVGQIRHVTEVKQKLPGCGGEDVELGTCKDTVVAGPVLVGGAVGALFELADAVALFGSLNLLGGFPNATVHADINAGVAFGF